MTKLHSSAKKFLEKHNPSKIGTLGGYDFYEDPILGDEGFLIAITPWGRVRRTCFLEMLDEDDLDYQVSLWNNNVMVYKTNGFSQNVGGVISQGDYQSRSIILNTLSTEIIAIIQTPLLKGFLNKKGFNVLKYKDVSYSDFENIIKETPMIEK